MKVLIIDWNSYGDISSVLERRGTEVYKWQIDTHADAEKAFEQNKLTQQNIESFAGIINLRTDYDLSHTDGYVFSFNYFPWISEICQNVGVPYVSWIYDSPFMDIYHPSVTNEVNYIFEFDYEIYREFASAGITTVHYLPLAAGEHITSIPLEDAININQTEDISFVGSLYSESKHQLYNHFNNLPPYYKGYLDAIILTQKKIYGDFILERCLTDKIVAEMEKCYPTNPNPDTIMTPRQIYSQFVLARQVTALERREIIDHLGGLSTEYSRSLFTNDSSLEIKGWKNKGTIDYYKEMPRVFHDTRINLNITLRSIRTGIPLRAWDICGAGGFLMTNYQAEYEEYFTIGEDLVVYEDYEDLCEKTEYYLTHEKERREIAQNGCLKVRNEHTMDNRIDEIEGLLMST